MITTSLIRALLEENTVTITGLGTFYVKKVPAQIKEEVIFPPQNMIEFENSKDAVGFDFISKISKWEQIRIDEAQSQVSEWIELLEKGLKYNKTVFFDDFGTFSKDFFDKIIFQSVINSQLNIENEGFEPILAPAKGKEEIDEPERITTNLSAPQNHQTMDEPIKDKRLILKKKTKKSDNFWFASTIFIALAVLGALFLRDKIYSFYQTTFTKDKMSTLSENVDTETIAYIDSLKKEIVDAINAFGDNEENIDDAKEGAGILDKEENSVSPQTSPMESNDKYLSYEKGKYYVIAGSFAKEADALRHIKQQRFEKYHAKLIVHPDSPRIRVAIGVFDNEEEALQMASGIDKNYWVLK